MAAQCSFAFKPCRNAGTGAARTVFDHAQVILLKWDADHYRIEVWNSFADHVWTLLETASREVELSI
ncbi:sarcosine oxidase subunit gamma [Brucella sp. 10RB9215]|nr:sarcosine oxidase subunit gamma [Brucella sp. 10RB9215]